MTSENETPEWNMIRILDHVALLFAQGTHALRLHPLQAFVLLVNDLPNIRNIRSTMAFHSDVEYGAALFVIFGKGELEGHKDRRIVDGGVGGVEVIEADFGGLVEERL
jgi:hypothetical protein